MSVIIPFSVVNATPGHHSPFPRLSDEVVRCVCGFIQSQSSGISRLQQCNKGMLEQFVPLLVSVDEKLCQIELNPKDDDAGDIFEDDKYQRKVFLGFGREQGRYDIYM